MAYDFSKSGISELNQELLYDLRQIYASDIVGSHLRDIAQARKANHYYNYFEGLKDLFIVVRHKIKKKKYKYFDKKAKKQVEVNCDAAYNSFLNQAIEEINKYPTTFTGQDKDPDGCTEIQRVLNRVEMFLYEMMEEANMFGGTGKIPGL